MVCKLPIAISHRIHDHVLRKADKALKCSVSKMLHTELRVEERKFACFPIKDFILNLWLD